MPWRTEPSRRDGSWACALLVVMGLLCAGGLRALVKPVRVVVTVDGPMARGACRAQAESAARRRAVLDNLAPGARAVVQPQVDAYVSWVIDGERFLDFERIAGRGCRLTAEFRIDVGALSEVERSALGERVPEVPIGVLLRYRVDGKLAADVGQNSRLATEELEGALAAYGYHLVSLAAAQDDYDRYLRSARIAFTHADDWSKTRVEGGEAETRTGLLENMRTHLETAVELGPMRDCGGLIAFGELSVRHQGPYSYGPGEMASARLHLQIQRLDDSAPVVLPGGEVRQVVGVDAQVARDQARASVIGPVARQIAVRVAGMDPVELSRCDRQRLGR